MKKRATIKDIAKKAGVTHSTVSRVINDNPAISEETRSNVLKVMKEMNYQPNLIARSLATQKTQTLALIAPDLNPHVLPIIKGIADTCRRYNYGLLLFSTDYWMDEKKSYLDIAKNWLVDGILIYNVIYHKEVPDDIKQLKKENIPFIFINKFLGTKKVNNVSIDNYGAVYRVIKHLVDLGHKKVGIINGGMMSVDGVERFEAFKKLLTEFDLEFAEDLVGYGNFFYNEAYEEMKKLLCLPDKRKPTAVFCANDEMALGAIQAAQDNGIKVPQDMAVVGMDDLEAGRYFKPALTTVKFPHEDIGGKAIDLLLKIMEDSKRSIEEISLESKLIIRKSSVV